MNEPEAKDFVPLAVHANELEAKDSVPLVVLSYHVSNQPETKDSVPLAMLYMNTG